MKHTIAFSILILFSPSRILFSQEPFFTNTIGMEFVLIKPGTMVVGRYQPTVGKPGQLKESTYELAVKMARKAATPGFTVSIKKPYYIGKFEVTQEQWEKVMGRNPSFFKEDKVIDDYKKHPVDGITWSDAQAFLKRLGTIDKTHLYRLPTEFEWEYAARAGAVDDILWNDIRASAVLSGTTTSSIGQKKPNAWGVYDMLGNVWEWVNDFYNEKIFAGPKPVNNGTVHVLKGASFTGDVKNATYMTHAGGPGNGFDVGLRVLMEVK